jgi:deoxyribonuclease-4
MTRHISIRIRRRALPLIGAHVSTAGGLSQVVDRALVMGAEAVQVFSSNPRTWRRDPPDPDALTALSLQLHEHRLPLFFHTIYLINLASPDPALRRRSALAVAHALVLGAITGASGVVTHVGSHRGQGFDKAAPWTLDALDTAVDTAHHDLAAHGHADGRWEIPPLLLETATGSGAIVGNQLEDLAFLLDRAAFQGPATCAPQLGLCLDTAHLFAAGYDIGQSRGLERFLTALRRRGLLGKVRLVHLNDSAATLASGRDRHANPGEGEIGYRGLAGLVRHPALVRIPFILEVPGADGHGPGPAEMALVKTMRRGAWRPPRAPTDAGRDPRSQG